MIMKRFKYIALIFILLLTAACTPQIYKTEKNGKINITATIFPQYDFARQIAGESANLTMLLPPGSESHTYEPSPQDIIKIQNSDLFIYTGGESDSWINDILSTINTDNMKIISLTEICETLEEEFTDGMQHEEEHEVSNVHEKDEHVWTSPLNALRISEKISDVLCEIDSNNADLYKSNFIDYSKKLLELDNEIRNIAENSVRKTIVVADRFPFRYFASEYGLEYFAAFPGCAEETEASIPTVSFLIDKVKEESIPVVFYLEFSNHKLADTIAGETGAKPLMLHSCHNVTPEELENGITYTELMRQNEEVLREALN